MDIAIKLLLGAAAGSVGGWLLGHARSCSTGACRTRPRMAFSIVAGAAFGAAMAWYLVHRGG